MDDIDKFEFDRSRGIIWVCDVIGSSKYLNDNDSVNDLEQFLPRLYWISNLIVEAYGCQFIKWTGDGFLAWCPIPLYREMGDKSAAIIFASTMLGYIVNVTQLGINTKKKIKIRHSLVFENDALIIRITHKKGYQSLDLIGRSIVLAFRLCGISSSFPYIATQKEIVETTRRNKWSSTAFAKRNFTSIEIERFFKGEKWATKTIFVSKERVQKPRVISSVIKQVKKAIRSAESEEKFSDMKEKYAETFIRKMLKGPQWCRDVIMEFDRFTKDELLGNLKKILQLLEKS
ncbi:MAG: hypothetical protein EHM20_01725 [Alphaproteobacteria bacterium]|nr:MAG: hypothetical protein EHM20_01725 [Alphaproteobacteria bacterium]